MNEVGEGPPFSFSDFEKPGLEGGVDPHRELLAALLCVGLRFHVSLVAEPCKILQALI